MNYRRFILACYACFMGFLLYMTLKMDTPTASSATWPLVVGILIILMLPEKRLGGKMVVNLVKALKGKSDV